MNVEDAGEAVQTACEPARTGSLVVKICGVTDADAVAAAVAAGVDRLGFVFARSPRQVTPARAAALAAPLPAGIARVAVMRRPSQAEVDAVLAEFAADWLQADAVSLARVVLPAGVRPMPVLRDGEAPVRPLPAALLYEAPVSGAGVRADWEAAARLARRCRLMLAGGLDSANVAAAVDRVRPAGVDVSSGVERAPGQKDPGRIRAFVAAAREAARRLTDIDGVPATAGKE